MRRMTVLAAAMVVVLLGLGTAGMVLAHTDDGPGGMRHSMSTSRGTDGPMGHMGGSNHGFGPWSHHGARVNDEVGYLREMIAHHREAVRAAAELRRSDAPAMRAFGRDIVATQSAQIRLMEGWLADWYPGEPTTTPYEPMMRDLSGLSGDRLDRVFLEDMIGHHMAAVMMSQQLLMRGLAEHEQVADLARTIRTDQMREIWWMRARLRGSSSALGGTPCPWSTMGL